MEIWRGHVSRLNLAKEAIDDFKSDLRKRHFDTCGPAIFRNQRGKTNLSPFENNSLSSIEFDISTPIDRQLAYETWSCKGTETCDLDYKDKKFPCGYSIVIKHFPTFSIIIAKGTHGENFIPGSELRIRQGLLPEARIISDQMDGIFGQSTASKIYAKLVEVFGDNFKCTKKQVDNYVQNRRRRLMNGMTDYELCRAFRENNSKLVLAYDEITSGDSVSFRMVLTSEILLNGLFEFGKNIIGLDAVWKYTVYKTPCWIIVFRTPTKSCVACYFLCTDGNEDSIKWCFQQLKLKMGEEWSPLVMIDHDSAEKNAVESCDMMITLCRFHSEVTFTEHTKLLHNDLDVASANFYWRSISRSQTEQEVKKNFNYLSDWCASDASRAAFGKKIQKYLSAGWDVAQSDVNRQEKTGFYNTNNFTEAQIKWLVPVNTNGKSFTMFQFLSRLSLKITIFEHFLGDLGKRGMEGRPGDVELQLATKIQRAEALNRSNLVQFVFDEYRQIHFKVAEFDVIIGSPKRCGCRSFFRNGFECKHILAAEQYFLRNFDTIRKKNEETKEEDPEPSEFSEDAVFIPMKIQQEPGRKKEFVRKQKRGRKTKDHELPLPTAKTNDGRTKRNDQIGVGDVVLYETTIGDGETESLTGEIRKIQGGQAQLHVSFRTVRDMVTGAILDESDLLQTGLDLYVSCPLGDLVFINTPQDEIKEKQSKKRSVQSVKKRKKPLVKKTSKKPIKECKPGNKRKPSLFKEFQSIQSGNEPNPRRSKRV